jgi:hypothetical protein
MRDDAQVQARLCQVIFYIGSRDVVGCFDRAAGSMINRAKGSGIAIDVICRAGLLFKIKASSILDDQS